MILFLFCPLQCVATFWIWEALQPKINYKIFFQYFAIFLFIYFILFVTFFQSCYLFVRTQKVATHCKGQNEKNHDNWLKNKKVIQCQKNVQKLKNFSLKTHKDARIKKTQVFSK